MKYIAALDVGTTTVRCHILDENGITVAAAEDKVALIYPQPGYVEIDPEELWKKIVGVMKGAMKGSGLEPERIACLGISTQRSSFTSWNMKDGKYYHRFITWKDLRADAMVKEWNSSIFMRGLRLGSRILYGISKCKRFLAGSVFKFMNTQISLRLLWALEHVPGLREAAANGNAVFGSVDCWLLYKFTGKHITDVSCASASGFFDPFTMSWATWMLNILKIPYAMFPEVVDTGGQFGTTPKEIFGAEIPILCSMADQAASLFGSCCFKPGDLKITMGTGSFVNVNAGVNPHASVTGLYPVLGWRIGKETVHIVEGASNDTGTLIEWTRKIGIIDDPADTAAMARSVEDSDGVCFVPAFGGLQAPMNDNTAAAGFIAIKPTTRKSHLVRALLESIVYRILMIYQSLCKETDFTYRKIRVDGGVSKNDFVLQLLADLTGLEVERATTTEISILGVAFFAGLEAGIWQSKEKIGKIWKVEKKFTPNIENQARYLPIIAQWKRAIERFGKWY